jgi:putative Holliday junction resolvase
MGRIAAIDYGLKRIGIAISNEGKTMGLPLVTIRGGVKAVVAALLARNQEIETIVVGLPLLMNGTKGAMALAALAFAKELELALKIPVVLFDERLSSKHAEASLREIPLNRKQRSESIDPVAAALLLQCYLDQR